MAKSIIRIISKPQDRKPDWYSEDEKPDRRGEEHNGDPSKRHGNSAARAARDQYAAQNEVECEDNAQDAPSPETPSTAFECAACVDNETNCAWKEMSA